jgi:hypothetical protein
MKALAGAILKMLGVLCIGIAAYVIVRWYIYWLAYYFIGNMKISVIIGLLTFFMAPLAGIIDLFWHWFAAPAVEMWKYFLAYFIGGKILLFVGKILNGR